MCIPYNLLTTFAKTELIWKSKKSQKNYNFLCITSFQHFLDILPNYSCEFSQGLQ